MKKFQFSLHHIRDYRDRLLDEEMGKLQRLRSGRDQIQQQIYQLEKQFALVSAQMCEEERKGTTILTVRMLGLQLENMRMQIKQLQIELKAAEEKVEKQTKVVVAANQEVSKLDKLRDRQYEVWQAGVQKAEEQRIEELVAQNYIRKAVQTQG